MTEGKNSHWINYFHCFLGSSHTSVCIQVNETENNHTRYNWEGTVCWGNSIWFTWWILGDKKVISVRIDSDLMYLTFVCELQLDGSCTVSWVQTQTQDLVLCRLSLYRFSVCVFSWKPTTVVICYFDWSTLKFVISMQQAEVGVPAEKSCTEIALL